MEIKNIIGEIKQKMEARGGLKAVYFVACGGSQAAIFPGEYALKSEAKNISTEIFNSNEFVHATPAGLDERCIVICCSLKATAETVEAVKVANKSGAVSIAMTGNTETGMAKVGQYVVTYSNGDNQVYSEGNQATVLRIVFEILHQFEGYAKYDKAMEAYNYIDEIVANAKEKLLPDAQKFAADFKDDEVFYVLACGPMYSAAYSMACCHLMEMQCRHAVYLNSGEYFHGPFETTDQKLAMILLKSSGRTRPMDDRVIRFFEKHGQHYVVIDVESFGLEKLDSSVAEFFNAAIMTPVERFFVATMADVRGHSMDYRRYMWKEEY